MFGRLFGTNNPKTKKAPPNINDSIQQLRKATNQLEKREAHLEKKIQVCLNSAKQKSKRRDKKGALYELKKKKQLEKQLESIQGKKLNLETQIMTLEDAHLNKETLKAMKTSAAVMKSTVRESDLDRADELMEDINEAMDQVAEMNEAMAQPLGQVMDDDELEAELAELEELEADELLNEMPAAMNAAPTGMHSQAQPVLDMPDVPAGDINANGDDEDAELRALEAMMN